MRLPIEGFFRSYDQRENSPSTSTFKLIASFIVVKFFKSQ